MSQPTPRNLVRLHPLTPADLPSHPSIEPTEHDVDLSEFLRTVLDEAVAFADRDIEQTFEWRSTMRSNPSTAPVRMLSHNFKPPADTVGGRMTETWSARESRHQNAARQGTATYAEFDGLLRTDHSRNEMTYTPSVFDAHRVIDWDELLGAMDRQVPGGYEEVSMSIYEMCHRMPRPLANRVFPVVVITARTDAMSFVVVQIPVDLTNFPVNNVLYANGLNRKNTQLTDLQRTKVIPGMYVSVERVQQVTTPGFDEVRWRTATASDAQGHLPKILQKLAMPRMLLRDVGLIIEWVGNNRHPPDTTGSQ